MDPRVTPKADTSTPNHRTTTMIDMLDRLTYLRKREARQAASNRERAEIRTLEAEIERRR